METDLAARLRDQNETGSARIPAEALAVVDRATAEVAESGIADSSLTVGVTWGCCDG